MFQDEQHKLNDLIHKRIDNKVAALWEERELRMKRINKRFGVNKGNNMVLR